MDLRLVEIFCRVYKERSFSRAAGALALTQPTVSAHIKELEESLRTPLFNRLGREIQPTDAGHFLFEHAQSMLTLKRDLSDHMKGFLDRIEGNFTVGASSVPGEFLLPSLVASFHKQHPAVRVRLRVADSAQTIEHLRHSDVAVGVIGAASKDDDITTRRFARDTLVLAVPGTAEWRRRASLTLRELRDVPLFVRATGSATRTALEEALARHKLSMADLTIAAEFGSIGAIKEAIRSGHGASFLSDMTIAPERRSRSMLTVAVPELGTIRRSYYVATSRRHVESPVTRAFLDHLRRHPPVQTQGGLARRPRR
jgi:DNA-binding transcriptional LysR family regulator